MALEINERVKAERIKKGYTQQEMGSLLNMNKTTYSQMERQGNIHAETLIEIADVLNVDILNLLYGSDNVISQDEKTRDYTAQEESIITVIRNFTVKDRNDVLNYIENKYKAQKSR